MPVAVGQLGLDDLALESGHLRSVLTKFLSLRQFSAQDTDKMPPYNPTPLDVLTDEFIVSMANKGATCINLGQMENAFWNSWERHPHAGIMVNRAYKQENRGARFPQLGSSITSFMFRDGLPEDAEVELCFAAARVPYDICQSIMEVSCGRNVFVAVGYVMSNRARPSLQRGPKFSTKNACRKRLIRNLRRQFLTHFVDFWGHGGSGDFRLGGGDKDKLCSHNSIVFDQLWPNFLEFF